MADPRNVENVLSEIAQSYAKARMKHTPMHGPHEGYAVLLEEVDELWAEVKRWQPYPSGHGMRGLEGAAEAEAWKKNHEALRKEALHVAAMALAFIVEAV